MSGLWWVPARWGQGRSRWVFGGGVLPVQGVAWTRRLLDPKPAEISGTDHAVGVDRADVQRRVHALGDTRHIRLADLLPLGAISAGICDEARTEPAQSEPDGRRGPGERDGLVDVAVTGAVPLEGETVAGRAGQYHRRRRLRRGDRVADQDGRPRPGARVVLTSHGGDDRLAAAECRLLVHSTVFLRSVVHVPACGENGVVAAVLSGATHRGLVCLIRSLRWQPHPEHLGVP